MPRPPTEPVKLPTSSAFDAVRLVVVDGQDAGAAFEAHAPLVRVGRETDNDFVLTDPAVSGYHCEISVTAGRVRISDRGSRNGVLLDGVPVYDGQLTDGCALVLGNTELRCSLGGADAVRRDDSESGDTGRFGIVVSQSAAMDDVFHLLDSAARTEVTVLLTGETGSGKGAAAESLHRASARADGPFVTVDCGAMTPTLLESQLFGHVRGAFTGATTDRGGAFEAARGGTLFLDEIAELPLESQPVLLRALETRTVRRVGSNAEIPIDVRLIAATNRDLRTWTEHGRFRPDLFYRLAVLEIAVPPLRARLEDLPLLVREMSRRHRGSSPHAAAVSATLNAPATLRTLAAYDWPGNVRELRNYVERCFVLGEMVSLEDFAAERPRV